MCLDNLCYCDDGFGGKGCDLPGNVSLSCPTGSLEERGCSFRLFAPLDLSLDDIKTYSLLPSGHRHHPSKKVYISYALHFSIFFVPKIDTSIPDLRDSIWPKCTHDDAVKQQMRTNASIDLVTSLLTAPTQWAAFIVAVTPATMAMVSLVKVRCSN